MNEKMTNREIAENLSDQWLCDNYPSTEYLSNDTRSSLADAITAALDAKDEQARALSEVWVLTREVNEYNQEGEYFVAVFPKKPTAQQLIENLVPEEDVDHVLNGGGRLHFDIPSDQHYHVWHHLRRVHLSAT